MNYLWGGMILLGIMYGAFTGNMQEVTDVALVSSKDIVAQLYHDGGVMFLWFVGMKIGSEVGIIQGLFQVIRPMIHFMFLDLPCS